MNKDKYAHKSPEWIALKQKVVNALYVKKNIGSLANEIMWIIEEEIKRERSKNTMRPRVE